MAAGVSRLSVVEEKMKSIETFVRKMKEKDISINYIQAYKGEELLGEYSRLDTKTRLNVYSVSKSVTSIGVGIAIKEGVLTLNSMLKDIFPEYADKMEGTYISKINVEHLLTMTCGLRDKLFFSDDKERYEVKDWISYFMEQVFAYEPGTHFDYSNFNTYMLSCILERVTGQTLVEYLKTRFFEKLGIGNPDWLSCPMGHTTAANGLLLTIDEMSVIGRFLLQEGVWNGERILSAEYIRDASKNHISTNMPKYGYGYQFWVNPDGESYRADGKYGQYIIVVPKKELVVTVQALESKKFFDDVWEELVIPLEEEIE